MSSAADALGNPTQAIAHLYSANKAQGVDTFPSTVNDHFKNVFPSPGPLDQIPTMDLAHPPETFANGSLVLFNCMIQDTSLPPELYLAIRKNGECGGWGITDDFGLEEDVKYADLRECTAVWAVSVPGLSSWCYEELTRSNLPTHHPVQEHKYPFPTAPHLGIQIKIYDENISRTLRTTDLASFVGILAFEPIHAPIEHSETDKVPTLHVFFATDIPMTIVPRKYPEISIRPVVQILRDQLIDWIADESLNGDRIAAEWILLCSIARVRSRHPPVLPLALTVSKFPTHTERPDASPILFDVLSLIFPLFSAIPLSLDNLNKGSLFPESKDEDLHSGQLQLPKGTVLIMNEGVVTEGEISNKGVLNIRAAQEMIKSQTLNYVFPYSNFLFETDIPFIILTEGKQSTFFQTDVTIPLRHNLADGINEVFYKPADAINLPSPEKLLQFRQLVGAKVGNVTIGEALAKHVEEDFVRERSTSNKENCSSGRCLTSEDLIRCMSVARLRALSLHQKEVTIEDWESAKALSQHLNP